jgi:hypothetical protein
LGVSRSGFYNRLKAASDYNLALVRVDYGFNVDPRHSEPPGMFYFSVGQAF